MTAPSIYGRDESMAVYAVRYCLGRQTYAVGECVEWLLNVWPALAPRTQQQIRRDIEREFARDDDDRAAGRSPCALGSLVDRLEWQRVRALWGA